MLMMKKLLAFLLFISIVSFNKLKAQANDNCANAIPLTVDGALVCSNTGSATTQTGEQCASYVGQTNRTLWYSFVATSTTMVLDLLKTNTTNGPGVLSVYGPNPSCVPGAGSMIHGCNILSGDPGKYVELTSLVVGATYLFAYNGSDAGGSNDRDHDICVGVYNKAINSSPGAAVIIDTCGSTFSGTTLGGYVPSGTGTGFRNLDNNLATVCPACPTGYGADVPYVINNDSWFTFCTSTAGTWNVTFNVGTCVLSRGLQMALFIGTANNMIWHSQAPSPTAPGGSWTSPTITLAAGQCVYLVVDGFAGDACGYSYTVTNLTGGCTLLPIELMSFTADYNADKNLVDINWVTETEINNDYFTVERSRDGEVFEVVGIVDGAGNSTMVKDYGLVDAEPYVGTSYYRLRQTDFDGEYTFSKLVTIENNAGYSDIKVYPNPVIGNANLVFNAQTANAIEITVLDVSGRIVYQANHLAEQGNNEVKLNIEQLGQGMYFVQIGDEMNSEVIKFIKD
jgi:hypothetical protein